MRTWLQVPVSMYASQLELVSDFDAATAAPVYIEVPADNSPRHFVPVAHGHGHGAFWPPATAPPWRQGLEGRFSPCGGNSNKAVHHQGCLAAPCNAVFAFIHS